MKPAEAILERLQSRGEEIANSISHGAGFVAGLIATPLLLESAAKHLDPAVTIGAAIFALSMLALYLASTLYHALPHGGRPKALFAVIDHAAIFLLIAGSYTPFTLGALRGSWGWILFATIWSLAIAGVCLKIFSGVDRHRKLSLCLYLGMGWLVIVAARPMCTHIPMPGLLLIACGGIAYTAGVPFYTAVKVKYAHFIWHLFVLAGTTCHFLAIMWYSA